jgi:hypothetical protein
MPCSVGLQTRVFQDGVMFEPEILEHFWTAANKNSCLLVPSDQWTIPANQTSRLALSFDSYDETKLSFFRVLSNDKTSLVKVFLNGATDAADGRAVSPHFCVSNLNLTSIEATNTSTTKDQVLQLYRIIPVGVVENASQLVSAIGSKTYLELLDTPSHFNLAGYQPYINNERTALEHLPGGGKVVFNTTAHAADYTVLATDYLVRFNATSANLSCFLPSASSVIGRKFIIKNLYTSTYKISITPFESQQIEGMSFYRLVNPGEAVELYSNGDSWEIVSTWQGL